MAPIPIPLGPRSRIRLQPPQIGHTYPITPSNNHFLSSKSKSNNSATTLANGSNSNPSGTSKPNTSSTASDRTHLPDNTLEQPFSLIEIKVQQLRDYFGKWLQFQSLWDLEAEYVFNRLRSDTLTR